MATFFGTAALSSEALRRLTTLVVLVVTSLAALVGVGAPTPHAAAQSAPGAHGEALPLGDADLAETRSTRTLAPGVYLTRIVRGTDPASPDQINTTTRGPWRVHVLSIDPDQAQGHLQATFGPDLAGVEQTTELVRFADALAGVNASFFTFTASRQYPGDPVGLGLFGGELLSEPDARSAEVDLVVDAATGRVLMGHLDWAGRMHNRETGAQLALEYLNHPPVVPADCAGTVDQTQCDHPGDVVRFTPEFATSTPSGVGVEVVLDPRGCVVRITTTRGTALTAGQTSLQATGRDTATLLQVADRGCLRTQGSVVNHEGERLPLRPSLFGVNGRYRLTADGHVVVPDGSGSFFARNPRTIAGTTRDGTIRLVTIDGRQSSSVGTTMEETAAVADVLGMRDAVNLDGGGSTTMSVRGDLVNQPSGTTERSVGDALVYRDTTWPRSR